MCPYMCWKEGVVYKDERIIILICSQDTPASTPALRASVTVTVFNTLPGMVTDPCQKCAVCLVAQSCPTLVTPQTAACQAPLSMGFPYQEWTSAILLMQSPGQPSLCQVFILYLSCYGGGVLQEESKWPSQWQGELRYQGSGYLPSSMNTFEYFSNQYTSCRSLYPRPVKCFLSRPGLLGIQKSWFLLLGVCFLASMLNVCSYVLGVHLNCYLIRTHPFVLSNLYAYDIRYNRGLLTTSGTQNYFESLLALNSSYCLLVTISK